MFDEISSTIDESVMPSHGKMDMIFSEIGRTDLHRFSMNYHDWNKFKKGNFNFHIEWQEWEMDTMPSPNDFALIIKAYTVAAGVNQVSHLTICSGCAGTVNRYNYYILQGRDFLGNSNKKVYNYVTS